MKTSAEICGGFVGIPGFWKWSRVQNAPSPRGVGGREPGGTTESISEKQFAKRSLVHLFFTLSICETKLQLQ